jgi:dATP/dGTP diphosphohydrolase
VAEFPSGAKSSERKPRYNLIPIEALSREAIRMGEGADAHGENNYRQGAQDAEFIKDRINHMLEHALLYAAGDRSTDHLAAVRCNAGMLMWIESVHGELTAASTSPAQPAAGRSYGTEQPEVIESGRGFLVAAGITT